MVPVLFDRLVPGFVVQVKSPQELSTTLTYVNSVGTASISDNTAKLYPRITSAPSYVPSPTNSIRVLSSTTTPSITTAEFKPIIASSPLSALTGNTSSSPTTTQAWYFS